MLTEIELISFYIFKLFGVVYKNKEMYKIPFDGLIYSYNDDGGDSIVVYNLKDIRIENE